MGQVPPAKGFTRGTNNPGDLAYGKGTGSPPSISCLCSPDKPMQMNQALFMSSGQCGYVLQPTNMRDDIFDPFDKSTLRGVEPLSISIEVSTSSPCGRKTGADPGGYTKLGVIEWFFRVPGLCPQLLFTKALSPA